ncbi:hypothetical protein [Streptomyces sp. NPDC001876]|uniref:hypothetical protein n=1 Tax=Streptomyces sp. NPDC001876 TaxID=3154402 RepID=UPI00331EC17E
MRVRMKVTLSGTRDGVDWPPKGEHVDLPKDEAAHMVAAGLATADTESAPDVEEATAPEPETSTPSARRRSQPKGK